MPPCGSSFFPSTPRAFAETSLYLIILSNVHLGSPPAVPPPPPPSLAAQSWYAGDSRR